MSQNSAKECLGYPSQKEAVIAFYEAAWEPRLIASRGHLPINTVHRIISTYRKQTGRRVLPRVLLTDREPQSIAYDGIWDLDEDERREALRIRAAAGARKTLEGAGN